MLGFLGFSRTKGGTTEISDTLPATRPVPGELPTPTQREIVRFTLHTLLKRHGISASWLGVELGAFPTAFDPEGVLIQLVIQHWHPGFGLYAPAIQNELMDALKRFDPAANPGTHHAHWKFFADCGCPHGEIPPASYWTSPAPVAATVLQMQAMPAHKPKFTRPRRTRRRRPRQRLCRHANARHSVIRNSPTSRLHLRPACLGLCHLRDGQTVPKQSAGSTMPPTHSRALTDDPKALR